MSEIQSVTELEENLPVMTSSIAKAMEALYNIQKALIKANRPAYSDEFQKIREHLQQYWKSIFSVLEDSYLLAGDVVHLCSHFQSADREQLCILVEELISNCAGCRSRAQTLIDEHKKSTPYYSQYESNFQAATGTPTSSNGSNHQNIDPPPESENPMGKFIGACDTFGKGVENLSNFFNEQLVIFRKYLATVQGCGGDVSPQEAKKFATKWEQRKFSILEACVEVRKVCDAVMIPPRSIYSSQGQSMLDQNHAGNWFLELLNLLVASVRSHLTTLKRGSSPHADELPRDSLR